LYGSESANSKRAGSKQEVGKGDKKQVSTAPSINLGNLLFNEKLSDLGLARKRIEDKAVQAAIAIKQAKKEARKKLKE
jgi:hypothetical protein